MKFLKLAVAAAFAFAFGNAYAFHSGGVAECEGCHSMHNSFEGSANVTGQAQFSSGPFLLKARDQSGACLNCHQAADTSIGKNGYHISTAGVTAPMGGAWATTVPVELTPGGDFAWLKTTRQVTIRGTVGTYDAERSGHNINAIDFDYGPDATLTAAPGGTYKNTDLHCSSCHDPHGKYRRFADGSYATTGLPIYTSGSYVSAGLPIANTYAVGAYRILGGAGYLPKSMSGSPGLAFANNPPDAQAPSTYQTVGGEATAQVVVAYGRGMSEWCANCHGGILLNQNYTSGMAGLRHPAGALGKLTTAIVTNYSQYVSSGKTNAAATGPQAYSTLAPFELGTGDYTAIRAFQAAPALPTTSNNVLCLSCHRAHASGFESMARYALNNEFMTIGDGAGVASYDSSTTENKINNAMPVNVQTNAYYNRPASAFGPWARDYCNKCHAKD